MLPELSEVRRRRKAAGISQKGLSKAAGTSQGAISKMEGGRSEPSYSTVKKIFDALENLESPQSGSVTGIMNQKVIRIQAGDFAGRAIQLMRQNDISQIPVFRREQPVGSVSERTVLERMREGVSIEALSKIRVESLMAPSFPVAPEGMSVKSASFFLENFPAVLIASKTGKIIGIVTKSDMLKTVKGKR